MVQNDLLYNTIMVPNISKKDKYSKGYDILELHSFYCMTSPHKTVINIII